MLFANLVYPLEQPCSSASHSLFTVLIDTTSQDPEHVMKRQNVHFSHAPEKNHSLDLTLDRYGGQAAI